MTKTRWNPLRRQWRGLGRLSGAVVMSMMSGACHMGVSPLSTGPGVEVRDGWAAEASAAQETFLRAVNAGDRGRVHSMLAESALLWSPEFNYVGKSGAVAELDAILGTGEDRVRLVRTGTATCLDEALLTAAIDRPGTDPEGVTHVSVSSTRSDDGRWLVTELRFVEPYPTAADVDSSCRWVRDRERFASRNRALSLAFDPQFLLRGQRHAELAPWDDGMRVEARAAHRLLGRTWAELLIGREHSLDDHSSLNDELWRREHVIGAILSYETGLARLGAGLAYSSASWAWYRPADRTDRLSWSRTAVGAIVEASTSVPLRQGFSLEGRVSGRTFGKTMIEPIADRPIAESGGMFLGVDFGVGYRF